MHFFLAVNIHKDPDLRFDRRLLNHIRQGGATADFLTAERDSYGYYHFHFPARTDEAVVLVLGGDGTMLVCANDLNLRGLSYPMLGINLGTLGFLTQVEQEGGPAVVDAILRGEGYLEDYPLLSVQLRGGDFCEQAINDVVVGRQGFARVLGVRVTIDGHLAYETNCDGIVVSTALGSTAYNLSLGGPVVPPETPVFLVTPFAPLLHGVRAIILPDASEISIQLSGSLDRQTREGLVTCDGRSNGIQLEDGDTVTIRKHPTGGRLLRLRDSHGEFFSVFREKLLMVR